MPPPHSRSQRRRQQRPASRPVTPASQSPVADVEVTAIESSEGVTVPLAPARAEPRAAGARSGRQSRRSVAKTLEPVDYSQDYATARHDLNRIAIIGVLLLVAMLGLGYAGVF